MHKHSPLAFVLYISIWTLFLFYRYYLSATLVMTIRWGANEGEGEVRRMD